MTIINFDDIIGKKFNTITNNIFCLSHLKNCLITGKKIQENQYFIQFNSSKFYI